MATMTVVDSVSEIMEETLNRLIAEGKLQKGYPLFLLGRNEPELVKRSMFDDFKLIAADEVYCYFASRDIFYESNPKYVNEYVLGLVKVVPVPGKKFTVTPHVVRGVYTPAPIAKKQTCKKCAAMTSEGYYYGNCSKRCWSRVFA